MIGQGRCEIGCRNIKQAASGSVCWHTRKSERHLCPFYSFLLQLLLSCCLANTLPTSHTLQEGACLVIALLQQADRLQPAKEVLSAIMPWFTRLRFYPRIADTPGEACYRVNCEWCFALARCCSFKHNLSCILSYLSTDTTLSVCTQWLRGASCRACQWQTSVTLWPTRATQPHKCCCRWEHFCKFTVLSVLICTDDEIAFKPICMPPCYALELNPLCVPATRTQAWSLQHRLPLYNKLVQLVESTEGAEAGSWYTHRTWLAAGNGAGMRAQIMKELQAFRAQEVRF